MWRYHDATTRIAVARRWPAHAARLTDDERRALRTRGFAAARSDAWIRGRLLLHRLLDRTVTVAIDADGAPQVDGHQVAVSHDGEWTAAMVAAQPIAIDVVAVDDARAARALRRVRWRGNARPTAAWAAFECALKLRRTPIEQLLDRSMVATECGARVWVHGLGPPLAITVAHVDGATVAWTSGGDR